MLISIGVVDIAIRLDLLRVGQSIGDEVDFKLCGPLSTPGVPARDTRGCGSDDARTVPH